MCRSVKMAIIAHRKMMRARGYFHWPVHGSRIWAASIAAEEVFVMSIRRKIADFLLKFGKCCGDIGIEGIGN